MFKANAYNVYQQNAVTVESPAKLIEMLYEGILKFAAQAKHHMEAEDIERKITYINKVTDIFTELLNILDYERGGEVAVYLTGLYTYQIKLLTQANVENDSTKIDLVMRVARGLLEAWREIHPNELAR
ncbi:flagellar export chaperone FliS [Helicobacter ailurogastricus]|uniref:Flagellar secretion chaperone FliS n=1 Tax=Helicobacter ailurogastricus TaxID=1578720 RepID=A0A0K2X3Z8_9HELI|nr:flagellar export chaperone FliS [Helicobacter ailurogastricus]CRF41022.1 Flagellar biosynthesis protein FliS [Helicobacter ailurogastricus]CRF42310.1 Flagellar biosynthesis protein FliS [Helicobacter ailurogastricus]CRF44792.1 Flagellar biosynthesis protein FliS [Helicobacter ailurogastricus]CRF52003.1 Flagellar biosynthesis protein FliS [Helicobacter ailurogastricus]BDQ29117.1 flagellar protein FliS [Helicobacter ailurogastricus]